MATSKAAEVLDPIYRTIAKAWNSRYLPTILWVFWLATRIVHILDIKDTPLLKVLVIDSLHYHQSALKFVEKGWGSDVWFMNPGYSTFLGILYWLITASPLLVVFVQTILEGVALKLTLATGRRLLPEPAIRFAMLLWVGYGVLPYYNGTLLTSIPILLTTTAAMYFLVAGNRKLPVWFPAAGGVMLGLSIALRPIPFLMLLVLPLFWFLVQNRREYLKKLVLIYVGALLALSPFLVHSYRYMGHLGLTQTSGGMVFWVGNHDQASGIYEEPSFLTSAEPEQEEQDYRAEASRRVGKELSAAEASGYWRSEGMKWIREHPGQYLALLWKKILWTGNHTEIPTNVSYYVTKDFSRPVQILPFSWSWILMAAGTGLLAIWSNRRQWFWIAVLSGVYLFANLIFYTASEYRLPLVPWLILLSGAGFYYFAQKLAEYNADKVMLGIMLLFPGFLWANYDNKFLTGLRTPIMDYFNFAQVSKRQGDNFTALEYYHKTLAMDPFYYEAHYELGSLYEEMGFSELSEQEFSRIGMASTDLDIASLMPVDTTANKHAAESDKIPANQEELLRKMLREGVSPDRAKLLFALGRILEDRSELAEAREMFVKAEAIDTVRSEISIRIAQIDMKQQRLDSALKRVNNVLEYEVDNVIGNMMKFQLLQQLGRTEEAKKQFDWLAERSRRDYHWAAIFDESLKRPIGFIPAPELKKIKVDTTQAKNGNW